MTGKAQLDITALADACYDLDESEFTWRMGIARASAPLLDAGWGVSVWTYHLNGTNFVPDRFTVVPEVAEVLRRTAVGTDRETTLRFLLQTRAKSVCERLELPSMDLHAAGAKAGLPQLGIRDIRALTVTDASGVGVGLVAPTDRVQKTTREVAERLERFGAHVLAGYRLRRALGNIDAVLGPDGTVHHAEGEARSREHREALRNAVKSFDRACARGGAENPDAALTAWQALVSGKWSIVQTYESDGRRYLVARRNPPGTMDRAALAPLEAQAILLRAQAASYKLIAYELGQSISSAQKLTHKAMRKLGIRDEVELPAILQQTMALTIQKKD